MSEWYNIDDCYYTLIKYLNKTKQSNNSTNVCELIIDYYISNYLKPIMEKNKYVEVVNEESKEPENIFEEIKETEVIIKEIEATFIEPVYTEQTIIEDTVFYENPYEEGTDEWWNYLNTTNIIIENPKQVIIETQEDIEFWNNLSKG